MNPKKVVREKVKELTDLPNVGKASVGDLHLLGIRTPEQLMGQCPFELYQRLCQLTQLRHDPCVLDLFMSITDFVNGEPPRPWWEFTARRKQKVMEGTWYLIPK